MNINELTTSFVATEPSVQIDKRYGKVKFQNKRKKAKKIVDILESLSRPSSLTVTWGR